MFFRPPPPPPEFDVVARSLAIIKSDPLTVSDVYIVPLSLAWFAGFCALDLFIFLLLQRALSSSSWETRVKIREALISCAHDLITFPSVYILLGAVTNVDDGPGGLLGVGPLAYIPMKYIDYVGSVFVGFLLWDFAHYAMHRETYARSIIENLVHHTAFILIIYLNRDTVIMHAWRARTLHAFSAHPYFFPPHSCGAIMPSRSCSWASGRPYCSTYGSSIGC